MSCRIISTGRGRTDRTDKSTIACPFLLFRGPVARRLFLSFLSILLLVVPASWLRADEGPTPDPGASTEWGTSYGSSDRAWWGGTALADIADMDSSDAMASAARQKYAREPRDGTTVPCPLPGAPVCAIATHRQLPVGEGNPPIRGMFGTRFPTGPDYRAFGALEPGIESVVAWALPRRFRAGVFGVFIGIGVADMIGNSYSGGVVFKF